MVCRIKTSKNQVSQERVPVSASPVVLDSLAIFEKGLGIVDMLDPSHALAKQRICDPFSDTRIACQPRAMIIIQVVAKTNT